MVLNESTVSTQYSSAETTRERPHAERATHVGWESTGLMGAVVLPAMDGNNTALAGEINTTI